MRVIAGTLRGRSLQAPPGRSTRPTPDRVREALFSALDSRLGGPGALGESRVLDLFAGSGALGIEGLSRGAARAVFVEQDSRALAALSANLEALALGARAQVIPGDAVRVLALLSSRGERFDVVFLDPPYGAPEGVAALAELSRAGLVRPGGVVVFEHAAQSPAPSASGWVCERTRHYGTVALTVYSPGTVAGISPAALPEEDG